MAPVFGNVLNCHELQLRYVGTISNNLGFLRVLRNQDLYTTNKIMQYKELDIRNNNGFVTAKPPQNMLKYGKWGMEAREISPNLISAFQLGNVFPANAIPPTMRLRVPNHVLCLGSFGHGFNGIFFLCRQNVLSPSCVTDVRYLWGLCYENSGNREWSQKNEEK